MTDIKEYIQKARESGYNDSQIIGKLVSVGWARSDVERHLARKRDSLAILTLILAVFLPVIALITGVISINRIGKSQDRGINFAIAGIILAIICTLAYGSFLISFVFAKFIGAAGIGNPPTDISVSGCGDAISLAIETSEGQPLLCYNKPNSVSSGQLHIMLKNSGRQDVLGWVVVYKGNTSMVTEYDVGLESASIVPFSFASGKSAYEDVEIHPIIQGYRSRSACSYEKLKFKIKELKECAKAGWSD